MNIQAATKYANLGYKIYRNPVWIDSDSGKIAKFLYVVKESKGDLVFMHDASHYAILTPLDCLANDWQVLFT